MLERGVTTLFQHTTLMYGQTVPFKKITTFSKFALVCERLAYNTDQDISIHHYIEKERRMMIPVTSFPSLMESGVAC